MKVELLAPAGDQESLIAAIQNGADAIYLGGTVFNARAFAKNFDKEQLKWAVEYAHLREVRLFVTLNTLYKDEEMNDLFDYVQFLYDIQIDALIIQDIGLFDYVRHHFPDFEVHLSTQASIMNTKGAQYFEQLGAKRIVLARENTLEEIREICQNTSLDVEVFVHGALCVCYSGQCLMSSMIGKRSGNRGACAQPCRLNYRLKEDNRLLPNTIPYLLSPKDLMTIEHIGDLIDAGVYSFKIEGRMKRPEYVASVVKAYRCAIDAHLQKKMKTFENEIHDMKQMFNRDYTNGYIFQSKHLLDGDYSGNKGIIIGQVLQYDKKKKRVLCLLNDELHQGDSIIFESIDKGRPINKMYVKGKLVSTAYRNEKVEIEFDTPVSQGNLRKIIDKELIQRLQSTYKKDYKKIPIKMVFNAHINQNPSLSLSYRHFTVNKTSSVICEKAIQRPLEQERIHQQLSKLGQTVFYAEDVQLDIDNQIIFPIKALNELRREATEELSYLIASEKIHNQKQEYHEVFKNVKVTTHSYEVEVSSLEQLHSVLQYPIHRIYYPFKKDALEAYRITKEKNIPFVLCFPRICKDADLKKIQSSEIYQLTDTVMVHDYGSYYMCHDKKRIIGNGLNIYNSYSTLHYPEEKILSVEISQKQMKVLQTDMNLCHYQVYGKVENMISEYCPITQYHFNEQKKHCGLCKKHDYALIDRKNTQFDLMMDDQCRMHLLHWQTLYNQQVDKILTKGLFFHFTNETKEIVEKVLCSFINTESTKGKLPIFDEKSITLGHFKD